MERRHKITVELLLKDCMIIFQHNCLGMNFATMLKVQYSSQIFLKLNIFQYICNMKSLVSP